MTMTQITTATKMSDDQIENAINKLRNVMREHRCEITSDAAQQVLGVENLGIMMFSPFRERAEAVSNLIVRKVSVNRNRNQQQAIEATGRVQYTDHEVVDAMPKGEGDEVEVVFFQPDLSKRNWLIRNDNLEKEFELRGLKPADPISVAAVNEADPAFADQKPHCTNWKDSKGKWYCAMFRLWNDERTVSIGHFDGSWDEYWWFAGVRK